MSAGNGSGGNLTLTKPTGTADGDLLRIVVYFEPDTTTISITGGFTEGEVLANTGAFKLQEFYKLAASEPASYTISNDTAGNQWRTAVGAAYSGGTGSGTWKDVSAASQADGAIATGQTSPSVTTTGVDRLLGWSYGNFSGADGDTTPVGAVTVARGWLGGVSLGDAARASAGATGTTHPDAGAIGTETYVGIHVAYISDIAGGRTTKNTRSAPLGVNIGMDWRSG